METNFVSVDKPVNIQWCSDVGFGNFTFYMEDGKLMCDNEYMSRDSVRNALMFLADNCILKDGEDD